MPPASSLVQPGPSSTLQSDPLARAILVVDDDKGVRDLMSRWLQSRGYWVASASGAVEALGLIESCPPAVALCDIRMPGPDGLWLADRIRRRHPDTAVIMATGVHDAADAAASLGEGVIDYLTKPFDPQRLLDAVLRGLQWHKLARDSRSWRVQMEAELESGRARLAVAVGGPACQTDEALEAMFAVLTADDEAAYAHGQRVAALAVTIAERMNLSAAQATDIRQAALLHDIGKVAVPQALLRKPAPLTAEEIEILHRYPELGAQAIAELRGLEEVSRLIRDAQERPDGLGYPSALRGPAVSIGARIIAVANAFDTMVSPRIYRDASSTQAALVELKRCSGTQFDSNVVAVLEKVVVERGNGENCQDCQN